MNLDSSDMLANYGGDFPNNKRYINKGERDRYLANYVHEAIISKDVFEHVQEEKISQTHKKLDKISPFLCSVL